MGTAEGAKYRHRANARDPRAEGSWVGTAEGAKYRYRANARDPRAEGSWVALRKVQSIDIGRMPVTQEPKDLGWTLSAIRYGGDFL